MRRAERVFLIAVLAAGFLAPPARQASAAVTILVPTGSVWKYRDNGSNQGTAWRAAGFADGSWTSGAAQLGYGDGDEATVVSFGPNASAKYVTTYFRRAFTVANPSAFAAFTLRLLRDDGAVVYLNGAEVFRSNMPGGTISYTTLAPGSVPAADETATFYSVNVSTNRLVNGTNVFAVEVHQASTNSSDLSFDLEFIGLRPVPPPRVSIRRSGSNAILAWSAFTQGFRLESVPTLAPGGAWSNLPNPVLTTNGQNSVTVNVSGDALFRLRRP